MLENLYTTKMSMDKKKLQNRFTKIRSKNGRISKFMAFIIFAVILLVMACVSIIIAANIKSDEYNMTEKEFSDYINRPIGAVMADIDYADENKLVFHYGEGLFVTNHQTGEIQFAMSIPKFNVSQGQQGSNTLDVKIDKDGKYAYLSSVGPADEISDYDKYIINLENGEVKKGDMPKNTELFTKTADTFTTVQNPIGWFSNNCILNDDKTYYLTSQSANVGDIQLVTVHHKHNNYTETKYVFGKDYVSVSQQKLDLIQKTLSDDEEILINSGLSWEVNANTVKSVFDKLSETRQMPYIDVKDGNYEVRIYEIWKNDASYHGLYVIDNYSLKILFSTYLSEEEYNSTVSIAHNQAKENNSANDTAEKPNVGLSDASVDKAPDNSSENTDTTKAVDEKRIKSDSVSDGLYAGFEQIVLTDTDSEELQKELQDSGITQTQSAAVDLQHNYVINDFTADKTQVTADTNGNISVYISVDSDSLFDVHITDSDTNEDAGQFTVLANNSNVYSFLGFEQGKSYNIEVKSKTKNDWNISGNYIIY